MYEKLNDDKYVTLTKREYDKLEERAKGVIGSYENRIKRLEEMVEHMKASKPYISHSTDFNYFKGITSITYVENTSDGKVMEILKKDKEDALEFQKNKFEYEIKKMTVSEFLKRRKEYNRIDKLIYKKVLGK